MRMDVTGFTTFIGVGLHKFTVALRAVQADGEQIGLLLGEALEEADGDLRDRCH